MPHIQRLVDTLLDIVLTAEYDLAAQARWGGVLHRLLRSYRRKLALEVPWRPLHAMLRRQMMEPSANYEGAGVCEARRSALVQVAHRARRFFPAGAAAEIWAHFAPALRDQTSPDAFEALGWLAMLLPTHAALAGDGDWGAWAAEWMVLWGGRAHCQYWQSLWFALVARLAKHDLAGAVDWAALLPEVWTRLLWAFHLPVGAATASPPFSAAPPALCQALFASDVKSRSASAAKAAVYLLGRCPAGTAPDADPALVALEAAVALVDQYYHPSNGGRWTPGLSLFMREAAGHLCKRLVAERYAATGVANGSDSDETDEDDGGGDGSSEDGEGSSDEDGGGGALAGLDTSDTDEDEVAAPGRGARPAARRHLRPATRRRAAAALAALAAKGQFAKDKSLARHSSSVLAQLAYVVPDLVLPSVHRHFLTALDTVTGRWEGASGSSSSSPRGACGVGHGGACAAAR
jgi:hypothetical protein